MHACQMCVEMIVNRRSSSMNPVSNMPLANVAGIEVVALGLQ